MKKGIRNASLCGIAVIALAGFLGCQMDDDVTGPVTLNDDAPPGGVSGFCMDPMNPENRVTCKVYYAGEQVFNTAVSHWDPVQGNGFYNCTSTGSDPPEGAALIVKGRKNGQPWGESAGFGWTPPFRTHITVWKYQ